MKHAVITPSGETYLTVWHEDGRLNLRLKTGHVINLDDKAIPQLRSILEDMELQMTPNPLWHAERPPTTTRLGMSDEDFRSDRFA